jgi:glycosyltransferase involved in cell wall biosynthesis
MSSATLPKVGYITKRYPRFSETFIVNEILAHEAAGAQLEIFSLLPPVDSHFQNSISRVRSPLTYLPFDGPKAGEFWQSVQQVAELFPGTWTELLAGRGEIVRDVHQALVLARLVRARGIGHLHAHFATSATTVARLAARVAGISYSFTAHAKDIFHEDVEPGDLRQKLEDAAAIITVSDFNLEYLRTTFGDSASKVRRLYNGLELERFPYSEPHERPPKIVAVGRLVLKKGFHVLIEACARLAVRGRKFSCEIVGAGEQETALRKQIADLGLAEYVELSGPRPQAEIGRHIQEAAVMAAPCIVSEDGNRDGLPTVLLEAMALGTPCVSTDVTGIPEVLRHEQTGLTVPQFDADALALACERLFDDAALRCRLARDARALIEREFDIHRNAARQREIFAACIRTPGSLAQAPH